MISPVVPPYDTRWRSGPLVVYEENRKRKKKERQDSELPRFEEWLQEAIRQRS